MHEEGGRLLTGPPDFVSNHPPQSCRIVTRVVPGGAFKTAPRRPWLKSYSFFIAFLVLPRLPALRIASRAPCLRRVIPAWWVLFDRHPVYRCTPLAPAVGT